MSARILLADDDRAIREALTRALTLEGYDVVQAADGAQALVLVESSKPDVAVLDVMMPNVDGLTVCRVLRAERNRLPVLMLTARTETPDRVAGLDAGADDYLAKPFELSELEARLRALYRRRLNTAHSVLAVGALALDTISRRFTVGGQPLELPPREHDLLEALMINAGRPVNKLLLADRLRSSDSVLSHDALEVYVHRLRRRIEGSGAAIHTLRGLGYLLEAADASPA